MSDAQLGFLFRSVERRYRVRELNREIADLLTTEFSDIWVEGEISSVTVSRPGHVYFGLKDEDSVLNCVCFRNAARLLRFRPEEGLAVAARGRIDIYEARGQYQFLVEALELRGQGALQLAFEQLKRKLEAEGLFRAERKRPLPSLPRRIGIVTSPTGAALQDMLSVLRRRFPGIHVRVYPALVQGDAAPAQVAAGLRFFSQNPWADVVIAGRGGGSLEDLWAFNTEEVARAIAESAVPVISAVGHETDFTIADFVADLRAPTPSAAAELAVPRRDDLILQLEGLRDHFHRAFRLVLFGKLRRLQAIGTERAQLSMQRRLRAGAQRVDDLEFQMRHQVRLRCRSLERRLDDGHRRLLQFDLRVRILRARQSLEALVLRLDAGHRERVRNQRNRVELLAARLRSLSPLAILDRGYALAQRADGSLARDAASLQLGEPLRVRFAKGVAIARVESRQTPAASES
ncbi:MAG: exodeoxyribonuclease VII large subunit [Bryobacterales bacterium]|jgi:exodeoxyribonuclease VII large subunit|nr:exodeoxyribonuclease VII large subunit [Bryobacterales bacterium]